MPLNEEIINRIKQIRKETGLSQDKFAKAIGVSSGNVSSWELGKALPGALALKSIRENLGYSINWILTGEVETQKEEALQESSSPYTFDPDLKEMIDIIKNVMETDDQEQRIWAKYQLKRAFSEFSAAVEKKQHA